MINVWLYLSAQLEDVRGDDSERLTIGGCFSEMAIDDGALEGTEIFNLTIGCATLNSAAGGNPDQLCIDANTLQFQIQDISKS